MLCAVAVAALGCGDEGGSGSQGAAAAPPGGCARVEAPAPKPDGGRRPPAERLDPDRRYDVTLRTSCGRFDIRLDQRASPRTAASFAALARSGFFDRTTFHRIVPGFVIQGGDPTGTGTGGPGYTTRDVPPSGTRYTRGTVAMAKTAAEPPGTAGSQFYVVTAPDAGLPPQYALLGKVVGGFAALRRIERLGDPASGEAGTPRRPVVIQNASVHAG
jgi:cyclophilin family peptidyl-prolyl cis-trans isomerase